MKPLLQHLEKVAAFVAIVRAGSLQAAAGELRLSQPSLSKTVAVLEGALGKPLLVRSRRGVTPTKAGQALAAFGEGVLRLAREAERAIAGAVDAADVAVACHEVIAGHLWPAILAATADHAGKAQPKLVTEPSARRLVELVVRGEVDVAIGAELPAHPELERVALYTDAYGLFAKPRAREGGPLIFIPESIAGPGKTVGSELRRLGLADEPRLPVTSYEAVAALAMAGLGTAVLLRRPTALYVEHGLLRERPLPGRWRGGGIGGLTIYAAWRDDGDGHARSFVRRIVEPAVRP